MSLDRLDFVKVNCCPDDEAAMRAIGLFELSLDDTINGDYEALQFSCTIDPQAMISSDDTGEDLWLYFYSYNTQAWGTAMMRALTKWAYDDANDRFKVYVWTYSGSGWTTSTVYFPKDTKQLYWGIKIGRDTESGVALWIEACVSVDRSFGESKVASAYSGESTSVGSVKLGANCYNHDDGLSLMVEQMISHSRQTGEDIIDISDWKAYDEDREDVFVKATASSGIVYVDCSCSHWYGAGGAGPIGSIDLPLRIFDNLGTPDAGKTLRSRVKWLVDEIGAGSGTTVQARLLNLWNAVDSGTYGLEALKSELDDVDTLLTLTEEGSIFGQINEIADDLEYIKWDPVGDEFEVPPGISLPIWLELLLLKMNPYKKIYRMYFDDEDELNPYFEVNTPSDSIPSGGTGRSEPGLPGGSHIDLPFMWWMNAWFGQKKIFLFPLGRILQMFPIEALPMIINFLVFGWSSMTSYSGTLAKKFGFNETITQWRDRMDDWENFYIPIEVSKYWFKPIGALDKEASFWSNLVRGSKNKTCIYCWNEQTDVWLATHDICEDCDASLKAIPLCLLIIDIVLLVAEIYILTKLPGNAKKIFGKIMGVRKTIKTMRHKRKMAQSAAEIEVMGSETLGVLARIGEVGDDTLVERHESMMTILSELDNADLAEVLSAIQSAIGLRLKL